MLTQILRKNLWFGSVDDGVIQAVASEMKLVSLASGEVLFHQGESGESLYLILSGRLRVLLSSEDELSIVRELGQGEVVGEMALLSREPRSATVVATRDTQLGCLTKTSLDRLNLQHRHQLDEVFIRYLAARLRTETLSAQKRNRAAGSVAIIPLSAQIPLQRFCLDLANAFNKGESALLLDAHLTDEYFGVTGAAQANPMDSLHSALATWLNHAETLHPKVIYQADPVDSPWTSRCIRQADIVLLVVSHPGNHSGDTEAARRRSDELLRLPGMRDKRRVLVLLHGESGPDPKHTKAWLEGIKVDRHFHVRTSVKNDFARLARFLDNKSVGLVLGAGFARGAAHAGVIRAMRELDIPIDMVGGTSMGAIVGGQCAMEWDWEMLLRKSCEGSISSLRRDYTLPLVALLTGARQRTAVDAIAQNRDIEDTWLPFFCVSSSLTRLEAKVHKSGSIAAAVIASSRIPGIFPPLAWEGELLVDGGLVNMVPVDIMRGFTEGGIVIGVNVSPAANFERAGYGFSVSGWKHLLNKLNPFQEPAEIPSFIEVLMRSVEFGRTGSKQAHSLANAYLDLPLARFGVKDFNRGSEMAEIGYRFSLQYFSQWMAESGRPWETNPSV